MFTCSICLNNPTSPACLPCGHVFCNDCIFRAVRIIAPFTTLHHCPSCQKAYSIVTLDGLSVPPHLRANLLPSIRKLHLSSGQATTANEPSTSGPDPQTEHARLRAENAALQKNCAMWRKRAEAHSSSTLGLLQLVKMAQDSAIEAARQRDILHRKCEALKRRLADEDEMDGEDEDPLDNSQGTFLPVDILGHLDKLSRRDSPVSLHNLRASPSPRNSLGLSIKRTRTPYESPDNSDEEEDRMPPTKRRRSSLVLSPLSGLSPLPTP